MRTDADSGGGRRARGSALLGVLIVTALAGMLCLAMLTVSTSETRSASASQQRLAALFVADSGIERQIEDLKQIQEKSTFSAAFAAIEALAGQTTYTQEVLAKDGVSVGEYTVRVVSVTVPDDLARDVTIESQGWVPSASAPNAQPRRVTTVVRVGLVRNNLFDYVYFIHNWGRLYGDKILVDGNARSNGRFDCGNFKAKIQGVPRFESVYGTDLLGYLDDNGDGIQGNDGGLYASWDINADSVYGQGGETWSEGDANAGRCDPDDVGEFKNQHEWWPQIPLPTLNDLSLYEARAKAQGSSIMVGDTIVVRQVLGDDDWEQKNLYLHGTEEQPIVIHGNIVVRGSVMISGVVTGQGTIFATGNIYVPQNLQYATKPQPLPRPGSRNESELENWLTHNKYDTDFLGLFAREHIVVGDYTDAAWQASVQASLDDPRNMTKEDAGVDGVPGTTAGRDGIAGTDDDDVLENDGEWTVEHYTQEDADLGIIPAGAAVGDPIPGTGEDLNGNGAYDGPITQSQFAIPAPLTSAAWAGNVPDGEPAVAEVATTNIYLLDAAFYSNNVFAMAALSPQDKFEINGCLIARYEAIDYDVKDLTMNYDYRLMAGDQFGFELPKAWAPIRTLLWRSDR